MKSLAERFENKYVVHPENGCWLWAGYVQGNGYGKIQRGGANHVTFAHRVAYESHKGPIPEGLQIDHVCRNRACVNPAHLRAVAQEANKACGERPMRTHCNHGHEFSQANTSWHHGYRRCKTCHREQESARKRGNG